jgi:predicted Zn-dependent protease
MRMPMTIAASAAVAATIMLAGLTAGCGRYGEGNLALSRGAYAEAEQEFERLVAQSPGDLTARRRLGITYVEAGDYEKAAEQFEIVQASRPLLPEEQVYYGVALIGEGQPERGFSVLGSFSYPSAFRVTQSVREAAADYPPTQGANPRKVLADMADAWNKGAEFENYERRQSSFGSTFGDYVSRFP